MLRRLLEDKITKLALLGLSLLFLARPADAQTSRLSSTLAEINQILWAHRYNDRFDSRRIICPGIGQECPYGAEKLQMWDQIGVSGDGRLWMTSNSAMGVFRTSWMYIEEIGIEDEDLRIYTSRVRAGVDEQWMSLLFACPTNTDCTNDRDFGLDNRKNALQVRFSADSRAAKRMSALVVDLRRALLAPEQTSKVGAEYQDRGGTGASGKRENRAEVNRPDPRPARLGQPQSDDDDLMVLEDDDEMDAIYEGVKKLIAGDSACNSNLEDFVWSLGNTAKRPSRYGQERSVLAARTLNRIEDAQASGRREPAIESDIQAGKYGDWASRSWGTCRVPKL